MSRGRFTSGRTGSGRTRSGRSTSGRTGRRRLIRKLPTGWAVAVLAALVFIISCGAIWYQIGAEPLGGPGPVRLVRVLPGWSVTRTATELQADKVISSALGFRLYLVLNGSIVVMPGAYTMHEGESYSAVASALAAGPPLKPLVVLPGSTIRTLAASVARFPGHSARRFIAAATSGRVRSTFEPPGVDTLEGLLYPDTYFVGEREKSTAILSAMLDRFDVVASSLHLAQLAARLGVTPYEAIIVASIVEKEALLPADKGKVARVIYNRLAAGMRLQMDSTVYYSLAAGGRGVNRLTLADLRYPSAYNTYLHAGLPPTPIASPDYSALEAALHPTPGPWMYFVTVSPTGREAFSVTYSQQLANERLARSRGLGGG